jgi:homoserine O-acetyltransferase
LKRYGIEAKLAKEYPDSAAREAAIRDLATAWGRNFDANGMLALLRAQIRFNAEPHFDRIRARVLYVLVSSDELYPPTLAPGVMAKLREAGVDATYFMLDSPYGHDATTPDAAKWAPTLKEFLANAVLMNDGVSSCNIATPDCGT